MERPSDLECTDALEVLTFEEEIYSRVRRFLPFEGSTDEGFWCLRGRCEVREGGRRENRCKMDVLLYTFTGRLDRGALQRWGLGEIGHDV